MSDKSLSSINSGTAGLRHVPPLGASGGKVGPESGKISPRQQASIQALNLDRLVRELNARSRSVSPALRFRVDVRSGTSIIQVFDRDSGKLIRQIPQEKAGALAKNGGVIDLGRIDDLA